MPSKIYAVSVQ